VVEVVFAFFWREDVAQSSEFFSEILHRPYRPFGGDASKKDQLCGGVSFIMMF